MKKIINGKKYDTDTAELISSVTNGYSRRDFGFLYQGLYRKKTGEYFLYMEGGPNTICAVSEGNNCWTGGEMIVPYTVDDAMQWCERYIDVDDYEKIFGEVEE